MTWLDLAAGASREGPLPPERPVAERALLIVPRALYGLDPLLRLAEPLAASESPHELIVAGVVPAAELAAATLALADSRDQLLAADSPPGLPRSPHRAEARTSSGSPARRTSTCSSWMLDRRRWTATREWSSNRHPATWPCLRRPAARWERGPWWRPSAPGRTTGRRSGSALGLPAPRTPRCG